MEVDKQGKRDGCGISSEDRVGVGIEHRSSFVQPQENQAPVTIQFISIKGFKSFSQKARIGPLTGFSCIIGPNGSGKSVIGEALAFAFGASPRTMRAKNVIALLNESTKQQSSTECAKVSVVLKLQNEEVKLSRILSGTKSQYYWRFQGNKRELSRAAFKEELAAIGIQTDAIDRFIVMQNQQAVKARNPIELTKCLELLIGASHLEEQIKEVEDKINKESEEYNELQQSQEELQKLMEKLEPDVQKWHKFNKRWEYFTQQRLAFLQKQECLLKEQLKQHLAEKKHETKSLLKVQSEMQTLHTRLSQHRKQHQELNKFIREALKKNIYSAKKEETSKMQVLKLQVRHAAAEKKIAELENQQKKEASEHKKKQKLLKKRSETLSKEIDQLELKKASLIKEKDSLDVEKMVFLSKCSAFEGQGNSPGILASTQEELTSIDVKLVCLKEELRATEQHNALCATREAEIILQISTLEKDMHDILALEKEQNMEVQSVQEKLSIVMNKLEDIKQNKVPFLRGDLSAVKIQIEGLQSKLNKDWSTRTLKEDEAAAFLKEQYKGRVHGRLADLGSITNDIAKPVNAILCHMTNMATTFVTEDREAANEVIYHFQRNRIGIVTCVILSEANKTSRHPCIFQHSVLAKPVLSYVSCSEKYLPVFARYLQNWVVVSDRNAATQFFQHRKNQPGNLNVVTMAGDLFKEDGEIIRVHMKKSGHCLLRSNSEYAAEDRKACSGGITETQRILENLLQEKEQLEAGITSEERNLEILQVEERSLQKHLHNLIIRVTGSANSKGSLQNQLTNKKVELERIRLFDFAKDMKIKEAIQHLTDRREIIYTKLEDERAQSGLHGLFEIERKTVTCGEEIQSTDFQIRQTRTVVNELHKQVSEEFESDKCPICHKKRETAVLKEELRRMEEQLQHEETERRGRVSELNQMRDQLALLEADMEKCRKDEKITRKQEILLSKRVDNLLALETKAKNQLSKVMQALPDPVVQPPKRPCLKERSLVSMEEMALNVQDEEGLKLAEEEMSLNEAHRTINGDALDEDLRCRKRLLTLTEKLNHLTERISEEKKQKDELEITRYITFERAMKKVNMALSKVYGKLTKHGDAYLTYTEEKSLLFLDGVHLHVRPDRHKWRSFSSLSGGQQALVALALSFSLQSAFPSPFYFFDEVDASLDTKNAHVVADYIKNKRSAQYIVVSHRPQVYELASTLVGVYHLFGGSASVSVSFDTSSHPVSKETNVGTYQKNAEL